MTNKVFFEETTSGAFVKNNKLRLKNKFWADEQYIATDNFVIKLKLAFQIYLKLLSKKIDLVFQSRNLQNFKNVF